MMQRAGFARVTERKYSVPVNAWPSSPSLRQLGDMMTSNFLTILDAMSRPLFTGALGWSDERLDAFLDDVRKDIADTRIHSFMNS